MTSHVEYNMIFDTGVSVVLNRWTHECAQVAGAVARVNGNGKGEWQ